MDAEDPHSAGTRTDPTGFTLQLPVGYRWQEILAFHGRDSQSVSERVDGRDIAVALVSESQPVVVRIHLGPQRVFCQMESAELCAKGPVKHQVQRMLGLTLDPGPWEAQALHLPHFARLVDQRRGLRIPMTPTPFEALAWAVMGQQISRQAASAMRRRLTANLGRPIVGGLVTFPTAEAVVNAVPSVLMSCGFSQTKADTLRALAQAVANGTLDLASLAAIPSDVAFDILTRFRGVGPWTARYALMRGIGSPDCAPIGDAVLAGMLGRLLGMDRRATPAQFELAFAPCAPWRSFAACHLWAESDAHRNETSSINPADQEAESGSGEAVKPPTISA